MTSFIHTDKGFIPVHAVRTVTAHENRYGVEMAEVRLIDGTTAEFLGSTWAGFLKSPTQLIPAEPGTHLIHLWPEVVAFSSVIAWALCFDGEMRPVTPAGVGDGTGDSDNGFHVLLPDGSIDVASSWNDDLSSEDARRVRDAYAERKRSLARLPVSPSGGSEEAASE